MIPTVWYDGLFNAFHHKSTVRSMKAEAGSRAKVRVYFYRTDISTPGIDVCACYCGKSKTSPIPEVFKERKHKLERLYDTIREEASLMNRNRTFSEDFRLNLEDYDINTRTYCMNVIRRQNIKPYAHFDCQTKM